LSGIIFFLSNLLPDLLYLLMILLCTLGFGSLVLQGVGNRNRMQLQFYIYSIALGMGLLAHLIFAIGAIGALYKNIVWVVILIGFLIGFIELIKHHRSYLEAILYIKNIRMSWFSWGLFLLLCSSLLYPLLANALVPSTSFDEVAYHLAIPKIYIQNHEIIFIPFILQSNWTLETEILFIPGLITSSENLAHLVTWIYTILVSVSLFMYMKEFFNSKVGLIAATVFASTPMVLMLAGTSMIEIPLTLYTLLGTMTMVEWLDDRHPKGWLLSAIFGGLAASTKLNAALIPVILGIFMVVVLLRNKQTRFLNVFGRFIIFGFIALIVVSPWYVKSWVHTGNPIWPFLFDILDGRNWDSLANENLMWFLHLPNLTLNLKNWLLGLWYLTIDDGKFGSFNLGWYYLILLPLSIPAFFLFKDVKQKRLVRWLIFLAIIYYTAWFFQTHQTRFLMPATSIFALLAAAGTWWLWQSISPRWVVLTQIAILILLASTHWFMTSSNRTQLVTNWPYLNGSIDRDQFLLEKIPGYQAFLFANQNLPPDAHIWLGLWESRGYYLEPRYTWMNPISQRDIKIEEFNDAEQLVNELRSRGITHIMLSSMYLDEFKERPHITEISDLIRQVAIEYGLLIFYSNPVELYELNQ
jgi:hypothetical protein